MYQLYVNTPFPKLHNSVDTCIQTCLTHKVSPEIRLDGNALNFFSINDFRKVASELKRHGITTTIHAPFEDLAPGSRDDRVLEATCYRFEQMLKIIPMFQPETVVCHTGYDWRRHQSFKEAWFENSLKFWRKLSESINDAGSKMMLENVYEEHPDDLCRLMRGLDAEKAGICFDVGHCSAFSGVSVEKWLDACGEYIQQLHLHDNRGKRDEHLALGRGSIDFQPVFDFMKSKSEPPVITLEPHKEEDLRISVEYLDAIDWFAKGKS